MATAPQTAMEMPQQGANPFADPNTMAVYDQMRQSVSPKQFGDEMLAGASQIDPRATAQFMDDLSQIDLSPEDLEMLNNMVDEILANPEQYAEVRAKYIEMGAPEELLPEQFDPQFFAAMNMAVDQLIAEPAGVQSFAMGGIAELKPIAKAIASYGRNGDTMLAHITPAEARMLRRRGGSGTINPATGLPEFFLKKAFKSLGKAIKSFASSTVGRIVTTVALGFFLGPAAASFLNVTSAAGIAAVTGFVGSAGSTLLAGGNLKDALKAGAVGGLTYGATVGVTGGAGAFEAGIPTTPGQAFQAQLDTVGNPFSAPTTAAPTQIPADTVINPRDLQYATPDDIAGVKSINSANASDATLARQQQLGVAPAAPAPAAPAPAAAPAGAPVVKGYYPPASTGFPQPGTIGYEPPVNTSFGNQLNVSNPDFAPVSGAGSGAPSTSMFGSDPTVQFNTNTLPAFNTAAPTLSGVEAPSLSNTSMFDSAKNYIKQNISPSGIQQAGMPAAQEAGAKAVIDLTTRIPDATAAMKEAAYQNAVKAATPGLLSTYGPATLVGLGTLGAFGGFSPKPVVESAQSKMLKGGPGSSEDLLSKNPSQFYVQYMPGVQYYDGSLRKPPGMATGGIVDAMPMNYAIGGGVDKQLYDAYTKGDYAAVNKIISDNKVTASEIQTRFNLSPADMAYIDTRPVSASSDINYYTPTKAETDAANVGIATVNPKGEAYSAADTAMYNAFRAGDYNLLNGLMATYSVTPAYIKNKFGLSDADINYITGQGGKFSATGPAQIKNTGTGTSTVFSSTPGFTLTPGGIKTMPKTTAGGTEMGTGTGVFPAIDDLQLAAGMDVNNITPQKMAIASGLGVPEVTTRYYNAKNEALLGNFTVDPATGRRTPIAARAPVAQPYNNASALTSYLSPTGPLGEFSTRTGTPAVPDAVTGGITTIPDVNYTLPGVQRAMPVLPQDRQVETETKLLNRGGIAGLAQGGYPRKTGQINGPGTATSDSIPAMLSDGEFVMTAKAVRGAGKGDRRAGAKRMYALMHQLEQNAARG